MAVSSHRKLIFTVELIPLCLRSRAFVSDDSLNEAACTISLGDATQQSLCEIWNGERYRAFRSALLSDRPSPACAGCGLR
jgi:hypothetical protein